MTAIELALIRHRNERACKAIDRKRSGVAPEVRPVSITPNAQSLMQVVPRKPPAKQSFGENYVKMVRLGAAGHKLHCALELSSPPFEVRLNVERDRRKNVKIPASECTPSAINPRFAGIPSDEPIFVGAPFGPWKAYAR
jgi:hypothetical protein